MSELEPKITAHIAVLDHNEKTGWSKELNIVAWGKNPPKYDIRSWNEDRSKCGKGITLNKAELTKLRAALAPMDL